MASPDGKKIISTNQNQIKVWSIAKKECEKTWEGSSPLAIFPDGKRIAIGSFGISSFDLIKGETIASYFRHCDCLGFIEAIAVSPDGRWVVSSCAGGKVLIWEPKSGKTIKKLTRIIQKDEYVTSLTISPHGQWIAMGLYGNMVVVWNTIKRKKIVTLEEKSKIIG